MTSRRSKKLENLIFLTWRPTHRFWFINNVLGGRVSGARRKYNVQYPIMYPTEKDVKAIEDRDKFMRVVRGHENWLENNAQVIFSVIAAWLITKAYATIFVLSLTIAVARVFYAYAYSVSPNARGPPFGISLLAQAAIQGSLAWYVAKRFI